MTNYLLGMNTNDEFEANRLPDSIPEGLRSREALVEPFEWYDRKRQYGAVQYDEQRDVYDVFSYDLVKKIVQDSDRFIRPTLGENHTPEMDSPQMLLNNGGMMWNDGKQHKNMKGDLFKYFTPNHVKKIKHTIERVSKTEIESIAKKDSEFDFAKDFAEPVSLKITMEILGVPTDDYEQIYEWISEITNIKRSEYMKDVGDEPTFSQNSVEYLRDLVEQRDNSPKADLISNMIKNTGLTHDEIGANSLDMMIATTKTQSEFLTNALYLYVTDTIEYDSTEELSEILEEVLRYRSPIQAQLRQANQRTEINGIEIQQGDELVVWFGAANRDPEKYDRPNEFVPDRNPEHLAFGSGPHACIGAPLARLEASIIIDLFIAYFDQIEIIEGSIVPKSDISSLGFDRLPVLAETTPASSS